VSASWLLGPRQEHRTNLRRIDAVLGGPVWWATHLGLTYYLVPRACTPLGSVWPLHAATVVLVLLCARAALSAIQIGRAAREESGEEARRDNYLSWLGLALAIFFGAVILAEGTPAFFQSPCL
jgi:hypothetical protein